MFSATCYTRPFTSLFLLPFSTTTSPPDLLLSLSANCWPFYILGDSQALKFQNGSQQVHKSSSTLQCQPPQPLLQRRSTHTFTHTLFAPCRHSFSCQHIKKTFEHVYLHAQKTADSLHNSESTLIKSIYEGISVLFFYSKCLIQPFELHTEFFCCC